MLGWLEWALGIGFAGEPDMDQRYVDTVRACKTLMRNLSKLDDSISDAQRKELNRLLFNLSEYLALFLEEDDDPGLWVGEE